MNAPSSSFPDPNPVTPPRPLLVHILYVVLLLLAFAAVSQLGAATIYWDTTAGAGNGVGGSGTWGTTFSAASTGSASLSTAATTDDLVFQGTAGVVTLGTTQTANSLTFNTTGYSIATTAAATLVGPLTLGNSVTLTLAPIKTGTLTIGSITGGTTSALTLAGANTAAGDATRVNLAAGTIASSVPISVTTTGTLGITGFVSSSGTSIINSTITNNSTVRLMIGATSGNTLTVNGVISGGSGVQFSAGSNGGAGTINLNAANTYTGSTLFNGSATGSVKLGVTNALPTTTDVVMGSTSGNGQVLDLNGFDQTIASLASNTSGTGSITNNATGTATNTLTVNGSTSTSFALLINDGTTRKVALTKAGSSTLTLTGASTYSGGVALNGGAINLGVAEIAGTSGPFGKSGTISFGGGAIQSTATNVFDYSSRFSTAASQQYNIDTNAQNVTWATALTSSGGSLTKSGTGALTLSAANTYSGGTTLTGGNIVLTNASGLGSGALNVGIGSTLDAGAGGSSGTGNRAVGFLNTVGLTGAVSIANSIVLPNDTVLNTRTLYMKGGTGNSTNFTGTISGGSTNTTLFLNNDTGNALGIVRLSGTNTFITRTGSGSNSGINVNRGSLQIDSNAALGNAANSLFMDSYSGQQLIFGGSMTYNHNTTFDPATASTRADLSTTAAGFLIDISANLSGGNSTSSLRLTSGVSGDKTTTYRLSGDNTGLLSDIENYRGRIVITSDKSVGTGNAIQLNGNNNTTNGDLYFENSMTLANNIKLANTSNPDPIHTGGNIVTLSGIVSSTGTAGLVKIGAGTLVLGGTNTYTVTTTISEGTLKVATIAANGTAQPLGQATSAITLGGTSTTGTFEYSGVTASLGRDFTVSSSTGSAGVIKNSGGGALTLAGTLTKDGKVLTLTGGAFTVSGKITGASANSDLVVDAATVTLTNTTNDYNGPTIIQNSGKVIMAGDYLGIVPASTTAGNVVLNNGTLNTTANVTLDAKRGLLIGPASGTGTGTLQADVGTTLAVNGALANNGSGTGSLTKAGAGNVTLTAANTYSGGTSVTAGTLQLGNGGTTGDASSGDIDVSSGATLKTSRSDTLTLAQAITGAGNLDVSNTSAGTTILSKVTGNSYSGTTTVNSGTLLANNTSGSATGTSTVSVNGATAVLGGTGTIGGATTVTLGQITPGTAALTGKLTFGNAVTLDGTSAGTRLALRFGASGVSDLNDAANIQSHLNDNTYMAWILTQASTYEVTTGGTHDRLSVDTLNLSSGGQIVVDNSAGYSPQFGDVFNLLDWTTFNKNSFNLGSDANNQRAGGLIGDLNLPGLASGLTYDLSLFNATGASGIVVVVPEPSRAVLVILAVVSLTLRRRR